MYIFQPGLQVVGCVLHLVFGVAIVGQHGVTGLLV
jgi:hypothetical protein